MDEDMDVLSVGLRVQLYIEEILAAFFVEHSRDTLRSSVLDGDTVSREGILICSVSVVSLSPHKHSAVSEQTT